MCNTNGLQWLVLGVSSVAMVDAMVDAMTEELPPSVGQRKKSEKNIGQNVLPF